MKRKRKTRRKSQVAKPVRAIHARIRQLRTDLGMHQQALAEACGATKSAVSRWEHGRSAPKGSRLPAVAAALGVTIDELYREAA